MDDVNGMIAFFHKQLSDIEFSLLCGIRVLKKHKMGNRENGIRRNISGIVAEYIQEKTLEDILCLERL